MKHILRRATWSSLLLINLLLVSLQVQSQPPAALAGAMYVESAPAPGGSPDLTNLFAWYKSDAGVTADGSNNVNAWADQSGNGHTMTQATGANQPLLISSYYAGYPAIEFDGPANMAATASDGNTFYVYVVLQVEDFQNKTIVGMGAAGSLQARASASTFRVNNLTNVTGGSNSEPSGVMLVKGVFNGSSSSIQYNNGTPVTGTLTQNNLNMLTLGDATNNACHPNILEILIYNGALTDATTMTYLNDKYSLW